MTNFKIMTNATTDDRTRHSSKSFITITTQFLLTMLKKMSIELVYDFYQDCKWFFSMIAFIIYNACAACYDIFIYAKNYFFQEKKAAQPTTKIDIYKLVLGHLSLIKKYAKILQEALKYRFKKSYIVILLKSIEYSNIFNKKYLTKGNDSGSIDSIRILVAILRIPIDIYIHFVLITGLFPFPMFEAYSFVVDELLSNDIMPWIIFSWAAYIECQIGVYFDSNYITPETYPRKSMSEFIQTVISKKILTKALTHYIFILAVELAITVGTTVLFSSPTGLSIYLVYFLYGYMHFHIYTRCVKPTASYIHEMLLILVDKILSSDIVVFNTKIYEGKPLNACYVAKVPAEIFTVVTGLDHDDIYELPIGKKTSIETLKKEFEDVDDANNSLFRVVSRLIS